PRPDQSGWLPPLRAVCARCLRGWAARRNHELRRTSRLNDAHPVLTGGILMALKITRATDPIRVERLNVCLYGQPGAGKTSLAFTASRPLLLDFDQGAHRAAGRKDTVQVHHWGDVAGIAAGDLSEFDTIIVDTAGRDRKST